MSQSPDAASAANLNADEILAALRTAYDNGEAVPAHLKNLAGKNFLGKDFSGLELTEVNFTGCELSRCNFENTICQNTIFDKATLFQAKLDGGEFLGASFKETNLDECTAKAAGLGRTFFHKATLRRASLPGATFVNADLSHADFTLAKLPKARMLEANLSHLHASQADMSEVDIREANLDHATFNKACLKAAQFRGVTNYITAYWIGAYIRDVDFAGAYLVRRHIADENYLDELQKQSRMHKYIYFWWWLTSDCGRSLFRWSLLQLGIVALFGFLFYQMHGTSAGIKADKPLAEAGFAAPMSNGVFTVNGVKIEVKASDESFNDIAARVAMQTGNKVKLSYDADRDLVNVEGEAKFEEDSKTPSNFTAATRVTQDPSLNSYWNNTDRRVGAISPDFAIPSDLVRNWYTPQYFAVVAATTLGFGDVLPKSTRAQIATNLLTIFGYFGLGGLMTILGNLLGRRGE